MNGTGLMKLYRQSGDSTVGANINAVEEQIANYVSCKDGGLSCGISAALHLAINLWTILASMLQDCGSTDLTD